MSKRVSISEIADQSLLFRMPKATHVFKEPAGPYQFFAVRDGPIHDYGAPICFAAGETMTIR